MSAIEPATRRGLRPRLPPVRRATRRPRGGDVRAVQGVDPAGARAAPIVAAEGRPVRAARRSSRSRRSSTSASATSPATRSFDRIEIITYREYVGVSSALLLFVALVAPDVMCPDRRQRVLPLMFARPLTGVDYVVAKVGAIVDDPVRLLVPPAGRAVRRQHARERQRARLPHATTSTCCGRCRSRSSCSPSTTPSSASPIASLTDRRIVAGAAIIGLFLVTSITAGDPRRRRLRARRRLAGRADQRARAAAVPPRPRSSSATSTRDSPLDGVDNGGLLALAVVRRRARSSAVGVLLRRYRWVER